MFRKSKGYAGRLHIERNVSGSHGSDGSDKFDLSANKKLKKSL
jgi:hypothetical protein